MKGDDLMNKRIIELRKKLKMTQEEFAEGIGMKRTTLTLIELNKSNITERTIILICKIYNVNREWLETGKGKMFNDNNIEKRLFFDIFKTLKEDEKDFLIKISKKL
jgi:transcriptional regulator with XRE-family HTH domain